MIPYHLHETVNDDDDFLCIIMKEERESKGVKKEDLLT